MADNILQPSPDASATALAIAYQVTVFGGIDFSEGEKLKPRDAIRSRAAFIAELAKTIYAAVESKPARPRRG